MNAINLSDVFRSEPPALRWLLRNDDGPVLRMGDLGMLSGAGGAGKTTALVQLSLAVATGRPWLSTLAGEGGYQTPEGGGRVLLAIAHEDAVEVRRRLYKAAQLAKRARTPVSAQQLKDAVDRITVLALKGADLFPLTTNDGTTSGTWVDIDYALRDKGATNGGWSLVILAPLVRFANNLVETSASDASVFVDSLRHFTAAPGNPAVLVSHYTTKVSRKNCDDVERPRGVRELVNGFGWHAVLSARDVGTVRMATLDVFSNRETAEPTAWLTRDGDGSLYNSTPLDMARMARAQAAARFGDR
jgi:hypothetical protein